MQHILINGFIGTGYMHGYGYKKTIIVGNWQGLNSGWLHEWRTDTILSGHTVSFCKKKYF